MGSRYNSVTLACDPPTRLCGHDYIVTAMWLEMFGGLTTEQVVKYGFKYKGNGELPKAPDGNKLNFNPARQIIRMSTA